MSTPPAAPAVCVKDASDAEIAALLAAGQFFWLDLENPGEARLEALAGLLRLHPLTVEDALTFRRRPKFEEYPGYAFMVVHGVDPAAQAGTPILREMHLIVSGDFVVTVHRRPFHPLDALRARCERLPVRSEQQLVYRILDEVTSTFFPVLDRIDDQIDEIEERVIDDPTPQVLAEIYTLKRDLVAMRRVVTPMRDVFARNVERITDLPGMEPDDRLYFRDLYDQMIRVSDLVDSYRDLLSGATDMYLSTIANRQGEISKQLTIIATVFLPLTFITGFFGQNFAFLTGHVINQTWTFWVLGIGLLAAAVIGFVIYFRRRRWL